MRLERKAKVGTLGRGKEDTRRQQRGKGEEKDGKGEREPWRREDRYGYRERN